MTTLNDIISNGILYLRNDQFQQAIDTLSIALDSDNLSIPQQLQIYYSRGTAYAKLYLHEQAIDDFTRTLTLNPRHPQALLSRASSLNALGQLDRAIDDYSKALSEDATFRKASIASDISFEGLDMETTHTTTLNSLQTFIEANTSLSAEQQAQYYLQQGCLLKASGDYTAAIQQFTLGLKQHKKEFLLFFHRAYVFSKCSLHHDAIVDYSLAIDLQPNNAYVYYNRGIAYDKIHCYDLAFNDFDMAISLIPLHPDFLHNRGYCAYKLHLFEAALVDYDAVLELQPRHYKALYNRSSCLKKLGRLQEADEALRAAAAVNLTQDMKS